jgi:hypothetical protein
MMADSCWLVPLMLLCLVWLAWVWRCHLSAAPSCAATTGRVQRLLQPRTPDDCPACRQLATAPPSTMPPRPPVTPWRERKSRRGAPKRIATQGSACPNRTCDYYQITDAQVHALVGDGIEGKAERIQTLRCQACRTTFTIRRHTPLYRLKTPSQRVGEVLTALAEGLSVSAAVRVFGYSAGTITRWLTRAGAHSATLHDRVRRTCTCRTSNSTKSAPGCGAEHPCYGCGWQLIRSASLSRCCITQRVPGARTQAAAHAVVHELHGRLAPGCIPVLRSDGLNQYFYALTAHFGHWVAGVGRRARQWQVATGLLYGQVKKIYRRRQLVRVTYVIRCGTRTTLKTALQTLGLSGRITTAFVERLNLTVRQSVAALIRRTWSTMQAAPQLLTHLEW